MNPIYSDQCLAGYSQPSIFLAGPTPRLSKPVDSWRPGAIDLLQKHGFDGTVFIPEYSVQRPRRSYTDQVEWEWEALHAATVVVVWVPRDLETLPAFTTNVEFGFYLGKKPLVYGRPDGSPKNSYLDWLYQKVVGKTHNVTLEGTLIEAMSLCRSGMPSCGNG